MAKEGYVVYVVTARERYRPDDDPRPLDDLDGKGADLISLARSAEQPFWQNAAPEKRARHEFAFRFNRGGVSWPGPGRLLVHAEAGPYGRRGRMIQVDTGQDTAFDAKDAAMIPLRAGLMTFPGERFGLLFCERRGSFTMRHDYEATVLKAASKAGNVVIKLETHVDIATWEQFLEDAEIASVKAVYFSTRQEDYMPSVSKESKLAMTVQGGPAERAGRSLFRQMIDSAKAGRSRPDAVLTGDLTPRGDGFRRDRVVLTGTAFGITRTVTFEESGFPQWTYELEHHPSHRELVDIWEAHGPQLIERYLSDPLT